MEKKPDVPAKPIEIKPKENKRNYTKKKKVVKVKSLLETSTEKCNKETTSYRTKKIRIFPNKYQRNMLRKWFGTYRFTYNYTKEIIIKDGNKRNFQLLRNAIVTEKDNTLMSDKKWVFETPKEIRGNAIRELLTNLQDKADVKYKSKKQVVQTITLPKQSYSREGSVVNIYPTKMLNEINKEGIKIKTSGIPIKSNEIQYAPKEAGCDYKITYSRPNIWHILIPVEVQLKEINSNSKNICALDVNIRNLVTGVGIDGNAFQIADKCYDKLEYHMKMEDKLKSKLARLKKVDRLEYLKTKNVLGLQTFKIKNLVSELHNKAIKYITDRYDIILMPNLKLQELKTNNKGFNRRLFATKQYQFRVKLTNKCKVLGKKLVIVSEAYTTQCCSECGNLNVNQGSSEIFNCPTCKKVMNRDVNSAKNILHRSLVWDRIPYEKQP